MSQMSSGKEEIGFFTEYLILKSTEWLVNHGGVPLFGGDISWYHLQVQGCSSLINSLPQGENNWWFCSFFLGGGAGNSNPQKDNGMLAESGWKLKTASTGMTALEHSRQTLLVNAQVLQCPLYWYRILKCFFIMVSHFLAICPLYASRNGDDTMAI